jgi:hypothetical protein
MAKIVSSTCLAIAVALCSQAAQAQSARTFVSAARGDDANPCNSIAAPCRTFQAAHDKTLSDGEVTVLDPGGYGSLIITRSINIINDGAGEASVLVSGGAVGILVNAPPAGYVNLRGITVQGIGFGGGRGIAFNTGFALTIENCVVRNHTDVGIDLRPAGNNHFAILNTLVADNGGRAGIYIQTCCAGTVTAQFDRIQLYNNSHKGLEVNGGASPAGANISAVVTDSVAANNLATDNLNGGAFAVHTVNAATTLTVVRSVIHGNGLGLNASGASILRIGQSALTRNARSWIGNVQSYVDNYIDGNGDANPAPPAVAMK